MLLQQTSKYLMKAIPQKLQTKLMDLSFVHSEKTLDYELIGSKLDDLNIVGELI